MSFSKIQKLAFIFLLLIFFVECFASILFKSPTWDEPIRLLDATRLVGRLEWEEPTVLIHPPLPYYIFGLPYAFFLELSGGLPSHPIELFNKRVVIYPIDVRFIVGRVPMIILGIILGIYVYRWCKELFGINAGLISLLIYAFSPNIIAHSRLITQDIAVTCFTFMALYYFWRFRKRATTRDFILSGVTLGFALLSKFSGVLLLPVYAVICIICILCERKHPIIERGGNKQFIFGTILVFFIALFVVWAGYGFQFQKLIEFTQNERTYGTPIPAGAYINGIRINFFHTKVVPRQFFLMGKVSPNTWWYFYLVGLLTKVPIATMVLFFLGALDFRRRRFLNPVDGSFLVVPVLFIFLYFSFFVPMNRGLRYILPVFPFVFVFIGGAVSHQLKGKYVKIIITLLGLWYVVSSIRIFPHYLSYFNEFAGGPDNGYRYLVDSDLDWGQDLKGLKRYMEKKNIDKIKLGYFGLLDPRHYGINYEKLKSLPGSGYVAVSATNLQNVYSDTPDYSLLRTLEPVDKIGYSILIYNLGEK